jgi:hypothetical protein
MALQKAFKTVNSVRLLAFHQFHVPILSELDMGDF